MSVQGGADSPKFSSGLLCVLLRVVSLPYSPEWRQL